MSPDNATAMLLHNDDLLLLVLDHLTYSPTEGSTADLEADLCPNVRWDQHRRYHHDVLRALCLVSRRWRDLVRCRHVCVGTARFRPGDLLTGRQSGAMAEAVIDLGEISSANAPRQHIVSALLSFVADAPRLRRLSVACRLGSVPDREADVEGIETLLPRVLAGLPALEGLTLTLTATQQADVGRFLVDCLLPAIGADAHPALRHLGVTVAMQRANHHLVGAGLSWLPPEPAAAVARAGPLPPLASVRLQTRDENPYFPVLARWLRGLEGQLLRTVETGCIRHHTVSLCYLQRQRHACGATDSCWPPLLSGVRCLTVLADAPWTAESGGLLAAYRAAVVPWVRHLTVVGRAPSGLDWSSTTAGGVDINQPHFGVGADGLLAATGGAVAPLWTLTLAGASPFRLLPSSPLTPTAPLRRLSARLQTADTTPAALEGLLRGGVEVLHLELDGPWCPRLWTVLLDRVRDDGALREVDLRLWPGTQRMFGDAEALRLVQALRAAKARPRRCGLWLREDAVSPTGGLSWGTVLALLHGNGGALRRLRARVRAAHFDLGACVTELEEQQQPAHLLEALEIEVEDYAWNSTASPSPPPSSASIHQPPPPTQWERTTVGGRVCFRHRARNWRFFMPNQ